MLFRSCAKTDMSFLVPISILLQFDNGNIQSANHFVGSIDPVAYCSRHHSCVPFRFKPIGNIPDEIAKEVEFAIESSLSHIKSFNTILTTQRSVAA